MSDEIFTEMAEGMAEVNDGLREAFARDGEVLYLLKQDGQSQRYAVVAVLTSGWLVGFDEYRMQTYLKYATTSDLFSDEIAQATHIGFGIPDDEDSIELYAIDPDRKDVIRPNAKSPFWKVFASVVTNERFVIT